jgi:regulator of protease activity HflC (stomatin/prohibitin superfamily)
MEIRKSGSGGRQTLPFLLVALIVGALALWVLGPLAGYLAFLLFGVLYVVFFAGKRQRLMLFVYLLLAVGLLVGGLVHARLGREATVARLGEFPLVGSLLVKPSARLLLAALAGVLGAAVGVVGPFFLLVLISAEWFLALRESYDLDRALAVRLLVYLALGIGEPYFIVENGEIAMTKPKGPLPKFGLPAVAVIKPYNAVVFERSGEVTRITGPGVVPMHRHERVKEIVDLRPQGELFEWQGLSKDNVPLTGKGFLGYRIESWESAKARGDKGETETRGFGGVVQGQYPVFERTLYRAVYKVRSDKDWQTQTVGMAQGQVGGAVRGYRVDEIFVVDEDERLRLEESILGEITEKARAGAVESARIWGVELTSFAIVGIEMPEKAQVEFLERWGEPWRGWREIRKSEDKLEVARLEAEASIAKAQAKAETIFLEGRGKARAWEEQYDRTLRTAIDTIRALPDEEWRVRAVVEVIRNLQPVDKRLLGLLFSRGGFLGRGGGIAPLDDPDNLDED